jgi:anti-anti-sigma regulatory factor
MKSKEVVAKRSVPIKSINHGVQVVDLHGEVRDEHVLEIVRRFLELA